MKKTGKGLQKLGLNLEAFIGFLKEDLLDYFEVVFWVFCKLGGSKEIALGLFIKCWIWDKNKVGILTPDLEYEGRR